MADNKHTDFRDIIGQRQKRSFVCQREAPAFDEEQRTVGMALTSDQPIFHGFAYIVLDHSPQSINLERFQGGLALLENHDRDRRLGRLRDAASDGHVLRATGRFNNRPYSDEIFHEVIDDLKAGDIPRTSAMFSIEEVADKPEGEIDGYPIFRATAWTIYEGSIVSIEADISVGVGRSVDVADEARNPQPPPIEVRTPMEPKENTITDAPTALERAEEIIQFGEILGEPELARDAVAEGKDLDAFKKAVHEKRKAAQETTRTVAAEVDLPAKDAKRYSIARAILCAAEGNLDGLEREVHDTLVKQVPGGYKLRGGVMIPTRFGKQGMETRAGLDSSTSTKGQELKFTEAGEFIDLLRNRMAVAKLGARMLTGLQGPVSFPKQNGAATASWVGENPGSDVADSNLTLTSVSLAVKTLQASTSYSRQLLAQGVIDVETLVREDLALIHGLAIDLAAINGSGSSNQPRGILNTSGIGSVAGGTNGAAPTYANIVDLETAVAAANADIGVMGYLSTAVMRGKLKQTQKFATTNGQAVWDGEEMNGYHAEVSNQVPSTLTKGSSSDCHAIIFGVWNQLLIGEWGALELVVDPYRLKKQGMIEVTSFEMVDIAIRYAEAFAAMKDARNV